RMDGPQVATVVGPPNEELWVDELGRVKVQFAWDRQGRSDENSSCWIDVAQGLAGATWGAMAIPRIGQEVTVDFWEGDCDRPFVSSRLPNAVQRPPYELPTFHALMPIRSKELKGRRSNELRLDDTPAQISAALMSDHASAALHLGYLTHPRPQGGEPRGEGFELRSDEFGAVRAGKGVLVSAYAQNQASGRTLDVAELLAQVEQLNQHARELLELAHRQQAMAADHGPRDALVQAVRSLGAGANDRGGEGGAKPVVVTGAPAGVITATPASVLQAAGANIEHVAGQDHATTAARRMHVTAGEGIDAFTVAGGIRHLAGGGDVTTQAQQGSVHVQASEDICQEATKLALMRAQEQVALQCQRTGLVLNPDGVVELFCSKFLVHGQLMVTGDAALSSAMAEHWAVAAAPHPLLSECGVAVGAAAGMALAGDEPMSMPSPTVAGLAPAPVSGNSGIVALPRAELPPPRITPTIDPLRPPAMVAPCVWHLKDIPPRNMTMDMECTDYYMVDRNYQFTLDGYGQKQLMRYGGAKGTFELRYDERKNEIVATLRMALVAMEVRVRANANAPFEMASDGRHVTVPYNADDYQQITDPVTNRVIYDGDRTTHPTHPIRPRDSKAPAPNAAALSKQAEVVLNADGYQLMRTSCGKGDACGCRIPVRFVVQVVNPKEKGAPKPHATVNVYEQAIRADSGNWGEVAVQQVVNKPNPNAPDYVLNPLNHVVAHEAGHLFSWPDEYYDNGGAIHRDCIENKTVIRAKVEALKGQPRWQGMTDNTLMGYGVYREGSGIAPYYLERIATWFQQQTGRPWRVVT
uniref:type VI secretion system Vgr family protein n=1 Tax=Dyella sp. ASV21 TaxID=2795114 RepID=UPI0018ED2CC0